MARKHIRETIMKQNFIFLLLLNITNCFSQPVGQPLYLLVTDNSDTLRFEENFNAKKHKRLLTLKYEKYQLIELSEFKMGFEKYTQSKFIHKSLMSKNHHILLIKNKQDTMEIEIRNCYSPAFLKIPFKKGKFKIYFNDKIDIRWDFTAFPIIFVSHNIQVYDITPKDWRNFEIRETKPEAYYYLSKEYEPVVEKITTQQAAQQIVKDFTNTVQLTLPDTLKLDKGDYNFDGFTDYRIGEVRDTSRNDYFIYNLTSKTFEKDTLLSSIISAHFDFVKKEFYGYKTVQLSELTRQIDLYRNIDNQVTLVSRKVCRRKHDLSERTDCIIYELVNGELIFKEAIPGAE